MTGTTIFHYTKLGTLALILKNKKLRLNRLDKVNDPREAGRFLGIVFSQRFYVSCWTKNHEESIPLWKLYGGDLKGVRIESNIDSLFAQQLAESEAYAIIDKHLHNITNYDVEFRPLDIDYNPEEQEHCENRKFSSSSRNLDEPENSDKYVSNTDWPEKKHPHWQFEKEFRLAVNAVGSSYIEANEAKIVGALPEYIDLSLSDDFFSNFKLTLGPKFGEEERALIDALLKSHTIGFDESRIQESSVRVR